MQASFIVFALSMVLMCFLLLLKEREVRRGKGILIAISDFFDPKLERFLGRTYLACYKVVSFLARIMASLRVAVGKKTLRVLALIDQSIHHLSNMVRGKTFLRKRGAVSFFLKDIADHKSRISEE